MEAGASLACSDLPVMHEVAGDYAFYFNPLNVDAMTAGIRQALEVGRRYPEKHSRFSIGSVKADFLGSMDDLLRILKSY